MVDIIIVIDLLKSIRDSQILRQLHIDIRIQFAVFLNVLCNGNIGNLFSGLIVKVTEGLVVKIDFHGLRG